MRLLITRVTGLSEVRTSFVRSFSTGSCYPLFADVDVRVQEKTGGDRRACLRRRCQVWSVVPEQQSSEYLINTRSASPSSHRRLLNGTERSSYTNAPDRTSCSPSELVSRRASVSFRFNATIHPRCPPLSLCAVKWTVNQELITVLWNSFCYAVVTWTLPSIVFLHETNYIFEW